MYRLILLFILLISQANLITAQSLATETKTTAEKHLIAVNKQWEGIAQCQETINFEDETQRIQFHLAQVLEYLDEADLSNLSNGQKEKRKNTIQELKRYRDRAIFPKNDVLPIRNPIFKDQYQTACAVAFLMEQTGAQEVVNLIQQESNFAYIEKLSEEYPQINSWADEYGFTLDELALIQPGYPSEYREFYEVGNGGPVEGKINVMKSNTTNDLLILAGSFSEVDGQAARNIIGWDGENWVDMNSPIIGEIHDIWMSHSSLVVVGDFYLEGNPDLQNIAAYKDGEWIGMQSGEMEGTVKTIHSQHGQFYVGGDFKKINGEAISYLAKKPFTDLNPMGWNNDLEFWSGGNTQFIENAFSINGPINKIIEVEDKILIAGSFDKTAPDADGELISQHDVQNIVFWKNDWINQMNQDFNEIVEAAYIENKIYLSDLVEENDIIFSRVHILSAGFWNNFSFQAFNDTEVEDQRIFGFFENSERAFAYGNIRYPDDIIAMIYTSGFMQLSFASDHGISFNGTVRAAESLGDRLYFAGDFTHTNGNGLVSADLVAGGGNAVHDLGLDASINVFVSEKNLNINYENLKDPLNFSLYNTSGQLIENFDLDSGDASIQKNLSGLSDGIYIYQLHDGNKMYSSKLSVF